MRVTYCTCSQNIKLFFTVRHQTDQVTCVYNNSDDSSLVSYMVIETDGMKCDVLNPRMIGNTNCRQTLINDHIISDITNNHQCQRVKDSNEVCCKVIRARIKNVCCRLDGHFSKCLYPGEFAII